MLKTVYETIDLDYRTLDNAIELLCMLREKHTGTAMLYVELETNYGEDTAVVKVCYEREETEEEKARRVLHEQATREDRLRYYKQLHQEFGDL